MLQGSTAGEWSLRGVFAVWLFLGCLFAAPLHAVDLSCFPAFRAIAAPDNFHPLYSLRGLVRETAPDTILDREGGLVKAVDAAKAGAEPPKRLISPIRRSVKTSLDSPLRLITDADGRDYLISHVATFPLHLFSSQGTRIGSVTDFRKLQLAQPKKPVYRRKFRAHANKLAEKLLTTSPQLLDFLKSDSLLDELRQEWPGEFEVALEKGIGFKLPKLAGYSGIVEGMVYKTESGGKSVLAVQIFTPNRTYVMMDATGQVREIPEPLWKSHFEPHVPALSVVGPRDQQRMRYVLYRYQLREHDRQALRSTLGFIPLTLFYPYVAPFRISWGFARKLAGQKFSSQRDRKALAAFLLLFLTGTHPGQYALMDMMDDEVADEVAVDAYSFWAAAEAELGPPPQGTVLVIDGVGDDDVITHSASVIRDQMLGAGKDVELVRARNLAEVAKYIQDAPKRTGKPIGLLMVMAHGDSLKGNPGDTPITIINIHDEIVSLDPKLVEQRMTEYTQLQEARLQREGISYTRRDLTYSDLNNLPDLSDSFAPGAQVRFISCNIAAGKCGEAFMTKWADQTIVKKGGGMISAGIPIGVPLELQDPRTILRNEHKTIARQLEYLERPDSTIILDLLSRTLKSSLVPPGALVYYPIYKWNTRSAPPKEKMTEVYKVLRAPSPYLPPLLPVEFNKAEADEPIGVSLPDFLETPEEKRTGD